LTVALLLLGCTDRVADRPNVILVVVDTLRADHLGAYGYARDTSPHLDAFAADAIRFERAYASAPWTKPSVASMLTGLHPGTHGVVRMETSLPMGAETLAERLSAEGFATGAVISHEVIGSRYGYDRGFDIFREESAGGHMTLSTRDVTEQAVDTLDALGEQGGPFFLLVHYFDPHYVYLRHPEYDFAGERPDRIRWNRGIAGLRRLDPPPNEAELSYLRDAYDEEIRFTDQGIGDLLSALRERGLYDDALILITADHGEEFFERGWLGHSVTVFDELVRVPLIARLPGGEGSGRVVGQPVSLVALPSTVLEVAGLDTNASHYQAPSLLGLTGADPAPVAADARPVYVELDYQGRPMGEGPETGRGIRKAALIDGPLKLVYDERSDVHSLFDLDADPNERLDLSAERPDELARLRAALTVEMARVRARAMQSEARPLDEAERARLEALGYLEGPSGLEGPGGLEGPATESAGSK
jgi:arylsulfatase A-like enzyme